MSLPRIGLGIDLHRLAPGRPCILGGVEIPCDVGPVGHSDGDAVLHAITDALLGAAGLGDIGHAFPDTDPAYAGADSLALLARACQRVRDAGYAVGNIDATIIAQAPRMAPHLPAMIERLADAIGCPAGRINLKAKTNERLGHLGRGEGIAAQAVALLLR